MNIQVACMVGHAEAGRGRRTDQADQSNTPVQAAARCGILLCYDGTPELADRRDSRAQVACRNRASTLEACPGASQLVPTCLLDR